MQGTVYTITGWKWLENLRVLICPHSKSNAIILNSMDLVHFYSVLQIFPNCTRTGHQLTRQTVKKWFTVPTYVCLMEGGRKKSPTLYGHVKSWSIQSSKKNQNLWIRIRSTAVLGRFSSNRFYFISTFDVLIITEIKNQSALWTRWVCQAYSSIAKTLRRYVTYRRSYTSKRIETSAVIRNLDWAEVRMVGDVSVGYRRWINVDPCARMWPSRNLLLTHLEILLYYICSTVKGVQGLYSLFLKNDHGKFRTICSHFLMKWEIP